MSKRGVAAVVHDELRAFVAGMRERGEREVPIFFERFALPREHRNAGLGDRGGGVVLRGENVAARPAHGRAEFDERLDEDRRLDGHVQRAGDAHAFERLFTPYFLRMDMRPGISCSETCDGLATPLGEREVADFEVLFLRVAVPLPLVLAVGFEFAAMTELV